MGKRWRKYEVGRYRLGSLRDKRGQPEAVVCWRDEDGPHRHRLGVFSETEGRVALDGFVGRIEAVRARDSQTIGDVFEAYVADREKDGKLIRVFRDNWKALKPRFAAMQIADINADICRDYATCRLRDGRIIMSKGKPKRLEIGVGTVWTELTRLRSALNWAFDNRVITIKPKVWVPKKPEPRKRVMTIDEVCLLIEASRCVTHIHLFVILAITTGGRSAAICELTWDRVDFDNWTIDLRVDEPTNPLMKAVRKGRALVPMTEEARDALQAAKAVALTGNVIEWDGAPVKKIRKGFQAAVKRAGLDPDVTPHVLRHTIATLLDEQGIAMRQISKLLGHLDEDTTRKVYAKPSVETLRPAAQIIDLAIRRRQEGGVAEPLRARNSVK